VAEASTATTREAPTRRELVAEELGLEVGALGVVAARHADHDVGPGRGHGRPVGLGGVLAREPEDVEAAGELDELGRPVARGEDGIQPLQRGDGRAPRGPAHRDPHGVDARPLAGDEVQRGVPRARGLGHGADVAHRLPERRGVEREHPRAGLQLLGELLDLLGAHGADRAQRLRHDEVGLQLADEVVVELVDRLAACRALAHRASISAADRPDGRRSRVTCGLRTASAG
jgi:hypothetical protein